MNYFLLICIHGAMLAQEFKETIHSPEHNLLILTANFPQLSLRPVSALLLCHASFSPYTMSYIYTHTQLM